MVLAPAAGSAAAAAPTTSLEPPPAQAVITNDAAAATAAKAMRWVLMAVSAPVVWPSRAVVPPGRRIPIR